MRLILFIKHHYRIISIFMGILCGQLLFVSPSVFRLWAFYLCYTVEFQVCIGQRGIASLTIARIDNEGGRKSKHQWKAINLCSELLQNPKDTHSKKNINLYAYVVMINVQCLINFYVIRVLEVYTFYAQIQDKINSTKESTYFSLKYLFFI